MTPDQMEAETLRYSSAAFFVLPLTSGRIAVLTPRRDLYHIAETWEEAKAIGPKAEPVFKRRSEALLEAASMNDLDIDLESL